MKQREINNAYPSIAKLLDARLPIKKARAIYEMYSLLEASYDFACREQQKYLDEYNITIENGLLRFHGENKESDYAGFRQKLDDLLESDVNLDIKPVVITEEELGAHRVSAIDIHNLNGFVFFD